MDEELPPPLRAGPLTPVIEGLLRKDPAERIGAEQAEHDLRIIGAGGTLRADTGGTSPYPPAMAAAFPQHPTTPPQPMPVPTAATRPVPPSPDTRPTTRTGEPDRNRRAAVVLVAGLAAVALAVAGLTYALLNHDNGGDDTGADAGSSTQQSEDATGASSPKNSPSDSGEEKSPTPSSSDSGKTSQPAQTVEVHVAGEGTDYSGSCPPSQDQAPAFTATFTVGNVPAKVSYRWVTETGKAPEQGWRTLSFPADDGKTKETKVFVTTYDESGTIENAIGVEVREPVNVKSNSVPFTVTCEKETPTDEVSSPTGTPAETP